MVGGVVEEAGEDDVVAEFVEGSAEGKGVYQISEVFAKSSRERMERERRNREWKRNGLRDEGDSRCRVKKHCARDK